jgi:SPP1 family predicted phage head-tail adaptor
VRAGDLWNRVTIERPTETRDAYGATVPGWAEIATVSASVLAMVPRELVTDSAQVAVMGFRVIIRWRSDVTVACRVLADGKVLLVRGVAEIGRRQGLQLICEQVI